MKQVLSHRPSPSMIVALTALVVAASGTAIAATKLVNGDKLIAKNSISGNRLKNHTITSTQVNLNKLGKVPSAASADLARSALTATSATNATNAVNAQNAVNAATVGGQAPGAFLPTSARIGTGGLKTAAGTASGNTVPLFTTGPFTVTMTCTKTGSGTSLTISASSSEANSVLESQPAPTANTPVDLVTPDIAASTTAKVNNNVNIDFEAPSGATAVFPGASGVNSLNTDCWTTWSGVR